MRRSYYTKSEVMAIYRRAFSSGFSSVLSLRGRAVSVRKLSPTSAGPAADAAAIRRDWERVGRQLFISARTAHSDK